MGDFQPELHVNGFLWSIRMARMSSSREATSNAFSAWIFVMVIAAKISEKWTPGRKSMGQNVFHFLRSPFIYCARLKSKNDGLHQMPGMNLFVNDIPVTILKPGREVKRGDFNHIIDARKSEITRASLINHVAVVHAGSDHLDTILDLVNSK